MKLVRYTMLIMALLVLSIVFLQTLLDLFTDVLNLLNEYGGFVGLRKNMGRVCLCGSQRECNINGTQGLESQSHLKWPMVGGAMESHVVIVLNIGEDLIPCTRMIRVLHVQDVNNHLIDLLCLVICLGVESSGFSEIGVQQ
jgi:hypothetical protein